MQKHSVSITTASDGTATAYTSEPVTGRVLQMRYVPNATTPLLGATATITAEDTAVPILTQTGLAASAIQRAPLQETHGPTGAVALYASGGASVYGSVIVAMERIKVAITSGGATKSGTIHFWVGV